MSDPVVDRWQEALESLREEDGIDFAAAAVSARVRARIRGRQRVQWAAFAAALAAMLLMAIVLPRMLRTAPAAGPDPRWVAALPAEAPLPAPMEHRSPTAVRRPAAVVKPAPAPASRIEIQTDDPDVLIVLVGDDGGVSI
jgi:hypothetical protein